MLPINQIKHHIARQSILWCFFICSKLLLLQFIKIVIYCSKFIDIYINRYDSPKVVDNYFNGTSKEFRISTFSFMIFLLINSKHLSLIYLVLFHIFLIHFTNLVSARYVFNTFNIDLIILCIIFLDICDVVK